MSNHKKTPDTVSLVTDPYQLRTLEITEAQNSADPLFENIPEEIPEEISEETDLEDDTLENRSSAIESEEIAQEQAEAVAAKMDCLARALSAESDRQIQELAQESALNSEHDQESSQESQKARLDREIAEDQALQAQIAAESLTEESLDPELQAALPNLEDVKEVQSAIEALLFVSDKPISIKKLHELLGPDAPYSIFQEALTELKDRYTGPEFGIEPVEVSGGFQFRTKVGRAPLVRKLARVQTRKLSTGAMESLAIIAYKQPVMKEDIDQIRGVDSSYFIRGLLDQKLITIAGRSELPGRPMLYSTGDEFLQIFGLKDLTALPPLAELERMLPASEVGQKDEDPRVKQMRKLVSEMNSDHSVSLLYNPREDDQILKEIKDRVGDIAISTPYLEAQKQIEKDAETSKKLEALNMGLPQAQTLLSPEQIAMSN